MGLLRLLIRKLTYFLAIFIILTGAVYVASQQLTPLLNEHKADFEKYTSQILHVPININHVQVSWFRYQPVLEFNDVSILHPKTSQTLLRVKKVKILFSILKSIWQQKSVPSGVLLAGADLSIVKSKTGELTIKELSSLELNQTTSVTSMQEIMGWLMQSPRLFLRDINLHLIGFESDNHFLTIKDLNFANSGTLHKLNAQVVLHQILPTEITLGVEWQGNTWDISRLNGKGYFYLSGVSLPQWFQRLNIKNWQVEEGIASAKIWLTLHEGKISTAQANVQAYGLKLFSALNQTTHIFNRISGKFGWKKNDKQIIVAGDDILIDMPDHLWPLTHFYLAFNTDEKSGLALKTFKAGYLNLTDIRHVLLANANWISKDIVSLLNEMNISGDMQQVNLSFVNGIYDLQHVALETGFSNLNSSHFSAYPGVKNLTGHLSFNGKSGKVRLDSENLTFEYPKIFARNLRFSHLKSEINISQNAAAAWVLQTSSLQLDNADLTANVTGQFILKPEGLPAADIQADFTIYQAKHISRYLPLSIFDAELSTWLKRAFLSGQVNNGKATLQGNLADFPFAQTNGLFRITGDIHEVDFRFAPEWPLLEKVNGMIAFEGRQINIDIDQAKTLGVLTNAAHGVISNLGGKNPAVLEVTTKPMSLDLSQAVNYIHQSPLEKPLGKFFNAVNLTGPAQLSLELTIPLREPEAAQVRGDLNLQQAALQSEAWQLNLEQVTGLVHFTESSVAAENIKSQLFKKPFEFGLRTLKTGKENLIQAFFTNTLSIADLQTWLKLPGQTQISGQANFFGTIDFSLINPMQIQLSSDLIGVTLHLPEPYGKQAAENRPLAAALYIQDNEPIKIKFQYADLLNAALLLDKEKDAYQLQGMNIAFGKNKPDWPTSPGVSFEGQFDELDWDKLKSSLAQSAGESSLPLRQINLDIQRFKLFNQVLTNVSLEVAPEKQNWQINLRSDEVAGLVYIPRVLTRENLIQGHFARLSLQLPSEKSDKSSLDIDVTKLPNLELEADNVNIGQVGLGHVVFKASTNHSGLTIQSLQINSPRLVLRSSGEWVRTGNYEETTLQGVATSKQVRSLLKSLGLHADNIEVSRGSINFNVQMLAPTYAPSIKKMKGHVSLSLGAGRIVDVGEQSGAKMDLARMLSLFSLQTLPRRLTLDFSDIYKKGYTFDHVRGDFDLQMGNIYTKNLRFEGPVARINIEGRIGLNNQDYDLTLTVVPHVTSTIPIAATLLTGNPLIGVGALVVNEMVGSSVAKVTENHYKITGSWDDPVWKPIKSQP